MRNDEVKEYLNANFQGIRAEMKADRDIFTLKLDQLIGYQEKQDNNVGKLEKEVHKNTVWRIRITAIGSTIAGVSGVIFGYVINTIKDLIK